jgi:chromosome segregation ATPase
MTGGEEIDQFQLLEEKIDHLIQVMTTLKREKDSLSEKLRIQEQNLTDLTDRLQRSEGARDKAKERIASLLDKIEQLGI